MTTRDDALVAPSAEVHGLGDESRDDVVPAAVLERDESAWRRFVARFDAPLRAVVRQAAEAVCPLEEDQVDDVMGDFWVAALANDMRLLRSFKPGRGSSLLTWLTFHVAHVANASIARRRAEPEMVPLDEARNLPAPWPRPPRPRRSAPRRPKLPSGRRYSDAELALLDDFTAFLAKLAREGKLDT